MHTFFTASDFLPTKWSTADEKAVFGNNLLHFMLTGFLAERFTEKLYTRLSMCFGHIAHYVEREVMRSRNTNTAWARRSDAQSLRIISCCGLTARSMVDILGARWIDTKINLGRAHIAMTQPESDFSNIASGLKHDHSAAVPELVWRDRTFLQVGKLPRCDQDVLLQDVFDDVGVG